MEIRAFNKSVWLVALVASMSVLSHAAPSGEAPRRSPGGYMTRLEQTVGLSPEQKDAVRGLMAEQREKTQALRQVTDDKIRGLLNVEQQKKFDAFRAQQKLAKK